MQLPLIKQELEKLSDSKLLARYNGEISTLDELVNLVENAIMDEPPITVKDGGVIKEGFNKELDELRHIMNNGRGIIDEIEQREKEATGIKNLKIGYNRVFGYYLEVTRSYYDLIPEGWIRKQTLANAERFITEELKMRKTPYSAQRTRLSRSRRIYSRRYATSLPQSSKPYRKQPPQLLPLTFYAHLRM